MIYRLRNHREEGGKGNNKKNYLGGESMSNITYSLDITSRKGIKTFRHCSHKKMWISKYKWDLLGRRIILPQEPILEML